MSNLKQVGKNYTMNSIGSMISLFFAENEVTDFDSAKSSNTELFGRYFNAMLENGVYVAPSQFESLFLSAALTDELADKIVTANYNSLKSITD